jgi:RimJ/RimL family protein N-acetyltransferase
MVIIETERLNIRKWKEGDWLLLKPMSNDVDVMRYLGGKLLSDEEIQTIARRQAENFETLGYCYWPLELKATGEFIGLCGVQPYKDEKLEFYDYGWRLAKEHWNHGYMTEVARAVRDYAFTELGLPRLTSTAREENLPSINVMKKMGMQFITNYDSVYGMCVRYELENPNQ